MQPKIEILELVIFLGATQGLFLAIVLWSHRRAGLLASRTLGILTLAFSLRLFEIVAYWTKLLLRFPHIWGTTLGFPYLFGPLLFLYIKYSTSAERRFHKREALHFLPFVIFVLIQLPFFAMNAERKLFILSEYIYSATQSTSSLSLYQLLPYFLQFPHVAAYIFLAAKLLKQFSRQGSFSGMSLQKLNWLRGLLIGFGCVFTLWLMYGISLNFGVTYSRIIDYVTTYAMTFGIYAIAYSGLRNPQIFAESISPTLAGKYEKSTLTPEKAQSYTERLRQLMENEKPYLNCDLNLPALAVQLRISHHHLSQVINEKFQQNFFDYVNRHRVEEAKRRLGDPRTRHFTMEVIAQEAGFNNKTTFNAAFKKYTGMTPTQFRDQSPIA
jgi:AraC-like DNA-binding protein